MVTATQWIAWKIDGVRNRVFRFRDARRDRLAVMGIFKNEELNIDEWVEHYLWQGASRIVLIDNGSTDATVEKMRAWTRRAPVTVYEMPRPHRQERHYRAAMRRSRLRAGAHWLLVADADEFWFPAGDETLAEALEDYRHYDVIYANCRYFGSGGHVRHPASLRRDLVSCSSRLALPDHTKWIARTDVLSRRGALRLHKVRGADSARTLTDNERFRLNHYITQSVEYFTTVKMVRGDAYRAGNQSRTMGYFQKWEAGCDAEDRVLSERVAECQRLHFSGKAA